MKKKRMLLYFFSLFLCCILFSIKTDAATAKMSIKKKTIGVGDTYQLKVLGTDEKVRWSVTSSSIATVNASGKVKGKKLGTTTVTAKFGNKKLTCKIVVHKHSYKQKTTEKVSCTKDGKKTYTCFCNKTYTKKRKAEGHTEGKYIVAKKATKTRDGLKIKKCMTCGKILKQKIILSKEKQREQKWMEQYPASKKTNQLILVEYKSGSDAMLSFHQKGRDGLWSKVFSTYAYVGRNGMDKKREGDGKTPTGTFDVKQAFGIQGNPGTRLPYTKVTTSMYWCGDRAYYNKLVDTSEVNHKNCSGEHLAYYGRSYNYSMVIDYNSDCVYGKGSAIFLHCTSSSKSTGGCIAIPESKMITLLRKVKPGVKIVIS